MASNRLSALDVSFLDVETASAHMHVGWAAAFDPPDEGPAPSFEQFRDHIGRRLHRAPRYRQRLAGVPLGVARPVWVDDDLFDITRHVRRADGANLAEVAGSVLSTPLGRDRPLWELWIADRLDDGRIGVIGKAHHCMVDGIAAVELAAVLLDPAPALAAWGRGRVGARRVARPGATAGGWCGRPGARPARAGRFGRAARGITRRAGHRRPARWPGAAQLAGARESPGGAERSDLPVPGARDARAPAG